MTQDEMLALASDAQNWRDAADWKDNCGRLRSLLEELPSLIADYNCFRNFTLHIAEEFEPESGNPAQILRDAEGLICNNKVVRQKYEAC